MKKSNLCLIINSLLFLILITIQKLPIYAAQFEMDHKIKVGYLDNYGVLTDEDGKGGYGYDYLAEVAKYTRWEYEYISCSWSEGLEKLASGELDIFGPLQKNPERETQFDFPNREMGFEYGALYILDSNHELYYDDIMSFDGMCVGTEPNNFYNIRLEEFCEKNDISVTYSYGEAADFQSGLESGKFDAVISGSILDIPGTSIVAKISSEPYYFATTKGNQQVLDGLNYALENIMRENAYFAADLDQKYYGNKSINMPAFTKEEVEYIKDHPVLTVVSDPDCSPFTSYNKKEDRYEGISVDILNELSEISGFDFQITHTKDYQESLKLFDQGSADLLLGYNMESHGLDIICSDSYMEVPLVIIGSKNIDLQSDLKVGIANLAPSVEKDIQKRYPHFELLSYERTSDLLTSIQTGVESYGFVNSYMLDKITREDDMENYISVFTDVYIPLRIGISKKEPIIVNSILNKSMKRITPEMISSIIFTNKVEQDYKVPIYKILKDNIVEVSITLIIIFSVVVGLLVYSGRKNQELLKKIAFSDPLTGLSTTAKFQLDTLILLKDARPEKYMLLCLDIDNFKYINDSLGYKIGNKVLEAITDHYKELKYTFELIGRSNGDNFMFLMETSNISNIYLLFDKMCDVGEHIKPILPKQYNMVFSAGVYKITEPDMDFASILDKANIARKSVKGQYISSLAEYTSDMNTEMQWKREITLSMESALQNGEFEVYLQPKYELEHEKLTGAEALVRWCHPIKGMMSPAVFIPLFEKNGFIQKLDFYMFEQVCMLFHKWKHMDIKFVPISVNISRVHLNNPNFLEDLLDLVHKYEVSTQYLEIELTESIMLNNSTALINVMGQLKSAGFKISIDDFGSGYSSLTVLKDLPADVLKIDKVLLDKATDTGKGQLIIARVIDLAKDLNLSTVAEGVETKEQAIMLREMGCEIAQGFYYSRPLPVDQFEALL